jgi:hypothetical protein
VALYSRLMAVLTLTAGILDQFIPSKKLYELLLYGTAMAPTLIKRPDAKFTLLGDGVLLEDISKEEVEEFFFKEFKRRFWDVANPYTVTDLEYDILTSKIRCCDCGSAVTSYNYDWKPENQRCQQCKR